LRVCFAKAVVADCRRIIKQQKYTICKRKINMNSGIFKGIIKGLAISGTILLVITIIKFFFAELNVADELITSIAKF
jgi:hypothetical protein